MSSENENSKSGKESVTKEVEMTQFEEKDMAKEAEEGPQTYEMTDDIDMDLLPGIVKVEVTILKSKGNIDIENIPDLLWPDERIISQFKRAEQKEITACVCTLCCCSAKPPQRVDMKSQITTITTHRVTTTELKDNSLFAILAAVMACGCCKGSKTVVAKKSSTVESRSLTDIVGVKSSMQSRLKIALLGPPKSPCCPGCGSCWTWCTLPSCCNCCVCQRMTIKTISPPADDLVFGTNGNMGDFKFTVLKSDGAQARADLLKCSAMARAGQIPDGPAPPIQRMIDTRS